MKQFISTIISYMQTINLEFGNVLEILIIAVLIYYSIRWLRNSRTRFVVQGIFVFLCFIVLANVLGLSVISYLFEKALTWIVFALLVIFQQELRQAFEQLGQKYYLVRIFTGDRLGTEKECFDRSVTEELVKGCFAMARAKTGALIVIERDVPLNEYIKTGIELDALTTGALLINIFEKNTPLHDGAVVMRGKRLVAATCYLPLSANNEINKNFGTRHRAALGVSEVTDSLTIVVSEETGRVSVASGGELLPDITPDELREQLLPFEQSSREQLTLKEQLKKAVRWLKARLRQQDEAAPGEKEDTATAQKEAPAADSCGKGEKLAEKSAQ